jgi:teichuronic acid biosynthesis glycosyltransferase TuaC
MKVLFVSSGTSKKGISPLVLNQGESLKKEGIEIEYFTINGKGSKGYISHIFKLRRHLEKTNYDIIHAHYGLSGLVAVFAKLGNQKLIVSFMGTDLLGNRSKNGRITLLGKLVVVINRRLADHAVYVIVKSREMYGKINCKNKAIIPNGVNLSDFYYIDKSIAIERLGWEKSTKHIFLMAEPNRPEKNFALASSALKLLNACTLELHIFQNIAPSEAVYYYNASDVCILSSFHEGSPNVIKEAMACCRPIVCTDVGDVKYVFGDTEGCYITSFTPDQMAEKIIQALNFSQAKRKTAGRERMISLGFDSDSIAKKIVGVYKNVINI